MHQQPQLGVDGGKVSQQPSPPVVASTVQPLGLPSFEQLAAIRQEAQHSGRLQDLRQMVAAWQAVAEKCDLAFDETVRLAVFRLEVERDLGAQLAQTVKRGGVRPNYPRGSLLPNGVTWKQSAAYQRLAAIPNDVFRAYIEKSRNERRLPSSAGARRFAFPKRSHAPTQAKRRDSAVPIPSATVLDAIGRVMTPDIVVGDAKIQAKKAIAADTKGLFDKLEGDVFIASCCDPGDCLPRLLRLRAKAQVRQAIVIVPAEPWAPWFAMLQESGVSCCFVRGQSGSETGQAVLHIGVGEAAFRVVMASVGVVVHA